jgi:hypothetical protein
VERQASERVEQYSKLAEVEKKNLGWAAPTGPPSMGAARFYEAVSRAFLAFSPLLMLPELAAGMGLLTAVERLEASTLRQVGTSLAATPAESTTANPVQVLQQLTDKANATLAANPAIARTVLSVPEYAAAQNSPRVLPMAYGNAIQRLVASEIAESPSLRALFERVGGPGKADFVGLGRAAGKKFDITTPGQIDSHLWRPYGPGLNISTYQRPPGLIFP